MVVPEIDNPFFPSVVKAVEEALHDSGMGLLLADASEDPLVEAARIEMLLDRRVDGLLLAPVDEVGSEPTVALASRHLPVVQVDRRVRFPTDIVAVDHRRGIALVVEHLMRGGRRSFAFVTTAAQVSTSRERLVAYQDLVGRADRRSSQRVLAGTFGVDWGHRAGELLLAGPMPEAVVCANDLLALGVLHTLQQAGVEVPAQVAVTGYDDTLLAEMVQPGLTSVRQPLHQLGQEAVRMLLSKLGGEPAPVRELLLTPELVVRASSGGPLEPETLCHLRHVRVK